MNELMLNSTLAGLATRSGVTEGVALGVGVAVGEGVEVGRCVDSGVGVWSGVTVVEPAPPQALTRPANATAKKPDVREGTRI